MLRTAAILFVTSFALPAIAQDAAPQLPKNSIDCNQFKKTGPKEWIEVGTAVFDLGATKDINLTDQPVTPGYFRFSGIDVYPVLEQKCGVPAEEAPAQAPAQEAPAKGAEPNPAPVATLAQQTVSPKAAPEQNNSSPAPAEAPARSAAADPAPAPEGKTAKPQQETAACGDRKSVYAADGLKGAAVEIAFQNTAGVEKRNGPASEFIIRQYKNKEAEWTYKGKLRRGRFIFTPIPFRERGFLQASISRQAPVILAASFIKPNRDGKGEPILYLRGLGTLFASKGAIRRFGIEGKAPGELLPEAFYFDRCE